MAGALTLLEMFGLRRFPSSYDEERVWKVVLRMFRMLATSAMISKSGLGRYWPNNLNTLRRAVPLAYICPLPSLMNTT